MYLHFTYSSQRNTEYLQNFGVIQECRKGTHFFIGAKEL